MSDLVTVHTPGGNTARFWCRDGTNDRMTVEGDVEQDRYGIASLPRKGGLYVDIGAHMGTWLVAALLDDPNATGIVVEPLPANITATIGNLEENDLLYRLEASHVAAFAPKGRTVRIPWDFRSLTNPEQAEMHRYIGGFNLDLLPEDTDYSVEKAPVMTPQRLLRGDIAVLKVAGETSEQALIGADLSRVDIVIGKYHTKLPKLIPWLEKTHTVTTHADAAHAYLPVDSFGWYRGVRK